MTKQMNNEHIRVAAYYLWQKAGCPNGMENDFWFQAQHQLYGSNLHNQKIQKSLSIYINDEIFVRDILNDGRIHSDKVRDSFRVWLSSSRSQCRS